MTPRDHHTVSLPRLACCLLFMAALLGPFLWSVWGPETASGKAKPTAQWPGLQKESLFNPDYYRAWVQYAGARLTHTAPLAGAKNWIDYRLFAMTEAKGVHVGHDGWLFDEAEMPGFRKAGCEEKVRLERLVRELRSAAAMIAASGRRFLFTVAPAKSTVYPENMDAVPGDPDCGQSPYDLFMAEVQASSVGGFVRLDKVLTKAKASQRLLYGRTGTSWNADGARIAAHMLMQALDGSEPYDRLVEPDDLTAAIMTPPDGSFTDRTSEIRPEPGMRATAVIYGGQDVSHLLPYLIPHFERLDVITAERLPSTRHGEDLAAYDTILLVLPESRLLNLQIDLDLIGRQLNGPSLATLRQDLNMGTIVAGEGTALVPTDDGLAVKSTGQGAYFHLPDLPGSDRKSQRLLQVDITAPHGDILRWSVGNPPREEGTRDLRTGTNRLFLPLPPGSKCSLRIYSGEHAGIFTLKKAVLLSFGEAPETDVTPPLMPNPAVSSLETGTEVSEISEEKTPAIRVNPFQQRQVFQRRGLAGDISVSGTYRNSTGAIEARVTAFDREAVVMPWTVIDPSPDNGVFLGTLKGVPQGGWYRLAVRLRDHPEVVVRGEEPWGVGILVACLGQSNMAEWFHTGDDIAAHPLMSIHRGSRWIIPETVGNGAAAFARALIAELYVPVGLLDYAVNGSGLHPEADWGTGHWADRSPDGIYRRFVEAADAAGGTLEYVIWMQGEADAARKTISGRQYGQALKDFIEGQLRRDIVNGSPKAHLPVLVVGLAKRPVGEDEPHQQIRNALASAARDLEDVYMAATSLDLKPHGHQHLAPAAYAALGRRVAQTVLYLLGRSDYFRGPVVDRIERVDGTTIDVLLHHHGGDDFSPHENITGFRILEDGSPVEIQQVFRRDNRSIRIQLGRPSQGELHLTYLYGARPDTSGAVHDNSELRLPLEPFEADLARPAAMTGGHPMTSPAKGLP